MGFPSTTKCYNFDHGDRPPVIVVVVITIIVGLSPFCIGQITFFLHKKSFPFIKWRGEFI